MHLQAEDLARLSCACSEMREAAATTELWRPLFEVSDMALAAKSPQIYFLQLLFPVLAGKSPMSWLL